VAVTPCCVLEVNIDRVCNYVSCHKDVELRYDHVLFSLVLDTDVWSFSWPLVCIGGLVGPTASLYHVAKRRIEAIMIWSHSPSALLE